MIVTLTGASGFTGTRLMPRLLQSGQTVRVLGRKNPGIAGVDFFAWEATRAEPVEAAAIRGADAIVHLAGEPVAQRWNSEVKHRIRDSRVLGTRHLVAALSKLQQAPRALVAASAIGYYGDRDDELLTENSAPGHDFLAQVCIEWERESRLAEDIGMRTTLLRTGIVLGKEGGALKQMAGPFKAGVGGPVGSGKQWVSWIHIDDMVELILFAISEESVSGPVNATSPEQARNADFAHALGAALGRPSLFPVPKFALGLLFGELAEVMLASQRVAPEAAVHAGFAFRYPTLKAALQQIFG